MTQSPSKIQLLPRTAQIIWEIRLFSLKFA